MDRNYDSARKVSGEYKDENAPPSYKEVTEKENYDDDRDGYDRDGRPNPRNDHTEYARYTNAQLNYRTPIEKYTDVEEFGCDFYSLWGQEDYFMFY